MADLLSKIKNKFFAAALLLLCLCCGNFQRACAEFSLNELPDTDILNTLEKKYQSKVLSKEKGSKEESKEADKEKMNRARETILAKKITFDVKNFITNVSKNNVEIVNLMLDAGMDVNSSYYGQYAIFYAAKNNSTESALLLLSRGANPSLGFDLPLWWAVKNNNFFLTQELVKHGVDVNAVDVASSQSILYLAVKKKHYDIARFLLENGAKIDNQTGALIQKNKLQSTLGVYLKQ